MGELGDDFEPGDYRRNAPRFQGANFQKNLDLVATISEIAAAKRATPAQLALGWVLAQGDDIVPIPGTKRPRYVAENLGALAVTLSATDLKRINDGGGHRSSRALRRGGDAGDKSVTGRARVINQRARSHRLLASQRTTVEL